MSGSSSPGSLCIKVEQMVLSNVGYRKLNVVAESDF